MSDASESEEREDVTQVSDEEMESTCRAGINVDDASTSEDENELTVSTIEARSSKESGNYDGNHPFSPESELEVEVSLSQSESTVIEEPDTQSQTEENNNVIKKKAKVTNKEKINFDNSTKNSIPLTGKEKTINSPENDCQSRDAQKSETETDKDDSLTDAQSSTSSSGDSGSVRISSSTNESEEDGSLINATEPVEPSVATALELCNLLCSESKSHSVAERRSETFIKRREAHLVELLSYFNGCERFRNPKGCYTFPVEIYRGVKRVVETIIFRSLPAHYTQPLPKLPDDDNEEITFLDPDWPGLLTVYELFEEFLSSTCFEVSLAKAVFDEKFLSQLISLLDSHDIRERESVKIVIHRFYLKFMKFRIYLRREMSYILMSVGHERRIFQGVSEILELYKAIISGFAVPIRDEHLKFLLNVLVPLRKSNCFIDNSQRFHLTQCFVEFAEKDDDICDKLVGELLRKWRSALSKDDLGFINDFFYLMGAMAASTKKRKSMDDHMVPLCKQLIRCLRCCDQKVVEKSLDLLTSNAMLEFAGRDVGEEIMYIIVPSLLKCLEFTLRPDLISKSVNMLQDLRRMNSLRYDTVVADVRLLEGAPDNSDSFITQHSELWDKLNNISLSTPSSKIFSKTTIQESVRSINNV